MGYIRALEGFGVRQAGSPAEKKAATYIAEQLTALGYSPTFEEFKLPNGKTSRNVVAVAKGASERTVVLGAHMDSKSPSPGANDNASGSAALIEMADILSKTPATATVQFVWFGSEEMIDSNSNHHHFGSRRHVALMTPAEKKAAVGMISVDMIGFGSKFVSRTMERGPQSMDKLLLAQAKLHGPPMTHMLDGGSSGQSDHEAFELAGIPASWIEWRTDPVYHTAEDTSRHVKAAKVSSAGQFVLDVVTGLDDAGLAKLAASK
jgi:aminopeptidase YwaD